MAAILSRPKCVKHKRLIPLIAHFLVVQTQTKTIAVEKLHLDWNQIIVEVSDIFRR